MYHYTTSFKSLDFLLRIKNYPLFGGIAKYYINKHMAFVYEVVTTHILASEQVVKTSRENIPLRGDYVRKIIKELEDQIKSAEIYLLTLKETFPQIIKMIQTKQAAFSTLMT